MSDIIMSEKCGQVFRSEAEQRSRQKSSVKKYACEEPQCRRKDPPVQFSRLSDLRRHHGTHARKQNCPYCDAKRDGRKDNFLRHLETLHGGGLTTAAYHGDEETVAWLLENHLDCGHRFDNEEAPAFVRHLGFSYSPLSWAAGRACVKVVRLLLDRGVNVNTRDEYSKYTALHTVVYPRDSFMYFNYTALHTVVYPRDSFTKENLEVLKLLLAKGADRQALTWVGETAFDFARRWQAREKEPNPFLQEAIELLRPEVEDQQQSKTSPLEAR